MATRSAGTDVNEMVVTELESDHSTGRRVTVEMRALVFNPRCVRLFAAILLLQSFPFSVLAQEDNKTGQDFYASRGAAESRTLNNAMQHHYGPGRDRMAGGNFGGAMSDFEFILNYFPNHPQVLISLSELCEKWKTAICDSKAEQWFQRAIERNPGAPQSYVVQAMYYHRRNRLDEAIKSYKRAVEIAPESINAHYNLGLAYADQKQYDQANLHAQKSYALGVTLPGLRARLQKAGKWNPNVTLPATETKPVAEPTSEASEKKPN